jgi:hypothetical protein
MAAANFRGRSQLPAKRWPQLSVPFPHGTRAQARRAKLALPPRSPRAWRRLPYCSTALISILSPIGRRQRPKRGRAGAHLLLNRGCASPTDRLVGVIPGRRIDPPRFQKLHILGHRLKSSHPRQHHAPNSNQHRANAHQPNPSALSAVPVNHQLYLPNIAKCFLAPGSRQSKNLHSHPQFKPSRSTINPFFLATRRSPLATRPSSPRASVSP